MGSEKKRKRRESEAAAEETPDRPDKAERKRLKRLAKEAAAKEADANGATHDAKMDDAQEIPLPPALVSPIATPMAGRKLTKKLFKLIGHAAKGKAIRRGIKEVVLAIRKADKGVVVMAGDVFPVEVIAHVPLLCEEANIPYCFVSRKVELGAAGLTKRPTSVVLVSEKKADQDVTKELLAAKEEVAAIQNLF